MRGWHELVAAVGDPVPGGVPVLGAALLLLTCAVAVLWFFWPRWVPAGWRRRRRPQPHRRGAGRRRGSPGRRWRVRWRATRWRWRAWFRRLRWRRRRRGPDDRPVELPPDLLPELSPAAPVPTADDLAAQGRYREAVRERLREIVQELVERGVVDYRPGWTVTELAAAGGRARPALAAPLANAADVFSGIWYGHRPAGPGDDAAMRAYVDRVRAGLHGQRVGA